MHPKIPSLIQGAVFDGSCFAFRFCFIEGINKLLKERFAASFVGCAESPYYRYWRIERRVLEGQGANVFFKILSEFAEGKAEFSPQMLREQVSSALANIRPDAFTAGLRQTLYGLKDGGTLLIGDYSDTIRLAAKSLGGRWQSGVKGWQISLEPSLLVRLIVEKTTFHEHQFHIFPGLYEFAGEDSTAIREVTVSPGPSKIPEASEENGEEDSGTAAFLAAITPLARTELTEDEVVAAMAGYQLYDYQQIGVRHLVTKNSALLGDDMGLGKTRQAIVAADIIVKNHDRKVLVVAPKQLLLNWRDEIKMIDPDAKIAIQKFDPEAKWLVVNYEQLADLVQYAECILIMIVDEAHYLKEPDTQRTRLAFDLAASIKYRYLLTGTPVLNRESEIHTLLRLSGHPVGNMPLEQFEESFAGNPEFRKGLNARIAEWMLRRKKEEVLTLQGKVRYPVTLEPSPEERAAYDAVAADVNLLALPKINKLRSTLETIKARHCIDLVKANVPEDGKVLIFCEFKATVEMLAEELESDGYGVVTVTGDCSLTKRHKAVQRFQQDPSIRVFIGTTAAAGVGITLTAANYVIFASLPWTPALRNQAEDRAYRNGQTKPVYVYIPTMDNSIDGDLSAMLEYKESLASDIMESPEDIAKAEAEAQAAFAKAMASAKKQVVEALPV